MPKRSVRYDKIDPTAKPVDMIPENKMGFVDAYAKPKLAITPEMAAELEGKIVTRVGKDGWVDINKPTEGKIKYWEPVKWGGTGPKKIHTYHTNYILDFRFVPHIYYTPSGKVPVSETVVRTMGKAYVLPTGNGTTRVGGRSNIPRDENGKHLSPQGIRSRRRKAERQLAKAQMSPKEYYSMYGKPVEDWDLEELARGRPRNKAGGFSGVQKPKWVPQEIHEQAIATFGKVVKNRMNVTAIDALESISAILANTDVDDNNKPLVSASTKLDASKFLLEHVVGKPTQHVEQDVSVKLQGILGVVMGNPNEAFNPEGDISTPYEIGHMPGVTMPLGTEEDIEDAEVVEDEDL